MHGYIPSFIYEFLFSEKFFPPLAGAGARSSRGFSRLALGMEDFLETKFSGSIKHYVYIYSLQKDISIIVYERYMIMKCMSMFMKDISYIQSLAQLQVYFSTVYERYIYNPSSNIGILGIKVPSEGNVTNQTEDSTNQIVLALNIHC